MSPAVRSTLIHIVFGALVLIAFGLAGSDDYAEAKVQEKNLCKREQSPEWCRDL